MWDDAPDLKNPKGGPLDKDWVTRNSGTNGHSVARHSVAWALSVLGTGSPRHWVARHSVAMSRKAPLMEVVPPQTTQHKQTVFGKCKTRNLFDQQPSF